jgi:hypothetical protein
VITAKETSKMNKVFQILWDDFISSI